MHLKLKTRRMPQPMQPLSKMTIRIPLLRPQNFYQRVLMVLSQTAMIKSSMELKAQMAGFQI